MGERLGARAAVRVEPAIRDGSGCRLVNADICREDARPVRGRIFWGLPAGRIADFVRAVRELGVCASEFRQRSEHESSEWVGHDGPV